MKIKRDKTFNQLVNFIEQENGVIVGKPGIGKSYLLYWLNKYLISQEVPVVLIEIDKLVTGTDASIEEYLGINTNWLHELEDVTGNMGVIGYLIFDAFDAARNSELQQQIYGQIRKAIQHLGTTWRIIVSARTYEAKKSLSLQRLFPSTTHLNEGLMCRHFEILELEDEDLNEVFSQNVQIEEIYKNSNEKLREILKVPFNLWLLENVIAAQSSGTSIGELKKIKTETELLMAFWSNRIKHSDKGEFKERLLSRATSKMVDDKTLNVKKEAVISDDFIPIAELLYKDDILVESSTNNQRIAYSHNILFDYAVSYLCIDDQEADLIHFIIEDNYRPYFLRPSFIYFFTRLWYLDQTKFWRLYWLFNDKTNKHIELFRKLIISSVIAAELNHVIEVEQVLSPPLEHQAQKEEAILSILEAVRFQNIKITDPYIYFLHSISQQLHRTYAFSFAIILEQVVDNKIKQSDKSLFNLLGEASRNLFTWVLEKRKSKDAEQYNYNWLGQTRGIALLIKTFHTDVSQSKPLIKKVLAFLEEPKFEITYFTHLCRLLEHILPHDPKFVGEIYYAVFGHVELSEDKTHMGGRVMNLISNRRQDFELCYHVLEEFYTEFLKSEPEVAIPVGLGISNTAILSDSKRSYMNSLKFAEQEFLIDGQKVKFRSDFSVSWFDPDSKNEYVNLSRAIIKYFDNLVATKQFELFDSMLTVYFQNAVSAFQWKILIDFGTRHIAIMSQKIFDLCVAVPILTSSDTIYEIGKFIEEAGLHFSQGQISKIEIAIIGLIENKADDEKLEYREHYVKRLLPRLPAEKLSTEKAKEFIKKYAEEGANTTNEPIIKKSWSSSPVTTEMILEEDGVNVKSTTTQKVLELLEPIRIFDSENHKLIPTREKFEPVLESCIQLFNFMNDESGLDTRVYYEALTKIASALSIITENQSELTEQEYEFILKVFEVSLANDKGQEVNEADQDFSIPAYSPTPLTAASRMLPNLIKQIRQHEYINYIEQLFQHPRPIIRYLIIGKLNRVWHIDKVKFWSLVDKILEHENKGLVFDSLVISLYDYPIWKEETENVLKALEVIINKVIERKPKHDFIDKPAKLLIGIYYHTKDETARNMIFAQNHPAFIKAFLFDIFDLINPINIDYGKEPNITHCTTYIDHVIDMTFTQLKNLQKNKEEVPKDDDYLKELITILDTIVSRIFFGLETEERARRRKKAPATDSNRQGYYFKMKPHLKKLISSYNEIEQGYLIAHTAHYFTELLNDALEFDPKDVLGMAASITKLSYPGGYTFDSFAIREVVKLTDQILADHKYILSDNEESLEDLTTLLDYYVKSGWPEALQLLGRLDEAFR